MSLEGKLSCQQSNSDSLGSIIGVINHWKYVILFSKAFLDGWQKRATKSP